MRGMSSALVITVLVCVYFGLLSYVQSETFTFEPLNWKGTQVSISGD